MNKSVIKASVLIAGMCVTSVVAAGESAFTGPSVGVKVSSVSNDLDYGGFLEGSSSSATDVSAEVYASYGFGLSEKWVLNVGASYALNDTDFGTENYLDGSSAESVKAELQNHWSVYIEPGYKFTNKWLGYAKLAYHEADGKFRDTLVGNGSSNINGFGYGLGLAYSYSNNIEARVEYQKIDFDRERTGISTGQPDVSEFGVSIGYRF